MGNTPNTYLPICPPGPHPRGSPGRTAREEPENLAGLLSGQLGSLNLTAQWRPEAAEVASRLAARSPLARRAALARRACRSWRARESGNRGRWSQGLGGGGTRGILPLPSHRKFEGKPQVLWFSPLGFPLKTTTRRYPPQEGPSASAFHWWFKAWWVGVWGLTLYNNKVAIQFGDPENRVHLSSWTGHFFGDSFSGKQKQVGSFVWPIRSGSEK